MKGWNWIKNLFDCEYFTIFLFSYIFAVFLDIINNMDTEELNKIIVYYNMLDVVNKFIIPVMYIFILILPIIILILIINIENKIKNEDLNKKEEDKCTKFLNDYIKKEKNQRIVKKAILNTENTKAKIWGTIVMTLTLPTIALYGKTGKYYISIFILIIYIIVITYKYWLDNLHYLEVINAHDNYKEEKKEEN